MYVFYSSLRLEVCHAVETSVLSTLPSFTKKVLLLCIEFFPLFEEHLII